VSRADEIIAALRAERIRQGRSQRWVGARILAAEASVGHWENRRVNPISARMVRTWHDVLGLKHPPDLDEVFRPDVPRCGTRPGHERHRRRGEYCLTCSAWWAAYMQVRRKRRLARKNAA
jgi:hypothetical protein